MKEILILLKRFDLKGLFIVPTKNGLLQFLRYIFVGGIATIVDWGILYIFTEFIHLYYILSSVISFIAGLLINFILSKKLVFQSNESKTGIMTEFIVYGVIGAVGLGITTLLMLLLTGYMKLYYMLSKVIATILVLLWNYIARKKILYK